MINAFNTEFSYSFSHYVVCFVIHVRLSYWNTAIALWDE